MNISPFISQGISQSSAFQKTYCIIIGRDDANLTYYMSNLIICFWIDYILAECYSADICFSAKQ